MDLKNQKEAENNLKKREHLRLIRNYIKHTVENQQADMVRLRTFTAHAFLWKLMNHSFETFKLKKTHHQLMQNRFLSCLRIRRALCKQAKRRGKDLPTRMVKKLRNVFTFMTPAIVDGYEPQAKAMLASYLLIYNKQYSIGQKMKEFIKNIGFINTRLREGMGLNRKSMLILKENLIREK